MKLSERRHAELEEEFYETWHPEQGTNMTDMLVHKVTQLEALNAELVEVLTALVNRCYMNDRFPDLTEPAEQALTKARGGL